MQSSSYRIEEREVEKEDVAVPMRRMRKKEVGCEGVVVVVDVVDVVDVAGAVSRSSARKVKGNLRNRPSRERLRGMRSWMMGGTLTSWGFAVKNGV